MLNTHVNIAFFGTSDFSLFVLEHLKKLGIMPALIVTTPDKPVGRKQILTPSPTKVWAENNSIEYAEPTKLKDLAFVEKMKAYELFVVASYGKIIPKEIIDIPKYKVLNIHPSLLPKYRGPSPLQEQILHDEKHIGVSLMQIDEQVDHGPLLIASEIEIENWPIGFRELEKILAKEGATLFAEVLPHWIKNELKAKPQEDTQATFTKKIEKQDGLIDLLNNPHENYLKTLAYEEWPKTYFEIKRSGRILRVVITKASYINNKYKVIRVIPEGKKEMDYADFVRGQRS